MAPNRALTQSDFFSPAFDSAIFDGPIRIYFSQHQEALALSLYYEVHEKNKKLLERAKECSRIWGAMAYVMIYPNDEIFHHSFSDKTRQGEVIASDVLGEDHVIGIGGRNDRQVFSGVISILEDIVDIWEEKTFNDGSNVRVLQ